MSPLFGNSNYPTTYRIGCGRRAELPSACRELGLRRPLVVTDSGLVTLPWFAALLEAFTHEGLTPGVFADVKGNPDETTVRAGLAAYRRGAHDAVLLVGGGSPMDVGKCIALLTGNDGDLFRFEDVGDNWKRVDPAGVAPIVAVPTTAGTGSEVGRAAVIVDSAAKNKKIIFHPRLMPTLVVADPEVTFDLSPRLTAATGMDALAHLFEAYCVPAYHPMADGIAIEGLRLVHENLPRAHRDGRDVHARTHMMMAAAMGATAFQKGLGLVHALSHPLGGATDIHHGTANAVFLPYVLAFNRSAIEDKMARLARVLELPGSPGTDAVLGWLLRLRSDLGLPHTLAEAIDFDEALARRLSELATQDPSMGGNPRPATEADCEALLLAAWRGDLDIS